MALDPALLPDNVDALKRLIVGTAREAVHASTLIEKLRSDLARLKRARFGASSEKLGGRIEQLELAIAAPEVDEAERLAAAPVVAGAVEAARLRPARRPLPGHLPRESVVHPGPCACPACSGALHRNGEDVTESLDYVPGRFKVVSHVREAFVCRACETAVQQMPAPNHAIARGRAGPGLLAHIAVAKFDDHLPLYRQAEIYARDGVELATSTLSGWLGVTAAAVMPLVDLLRREVIAGSDVLHGDDAPIPVLAPGAGRTKTGRLWDLRARRTSPRWRPAAGSGVLRLARPCRATCRSRFCITCSSAASLERSRGWRRDVNQHSLGFVFWANVCRLREKLAATLRRAMPMGASKAWLLPPSGGLTASGTTQASAPTMKRDLEKAKTVLSGTGVRLPATMPGYGLRVTNARVNALRIYPTVGELIDGQAVDAPFAFFPNHSATSSDAAAGVWRSAASQRIIAASIVQASTAGSDITLATFTLLGVLLGSNDGVRVWSL